MDKNGQLQLPNSANKVTIDDEQMYLLKVGRMYHESTISKEKAKSLNITLDCLSIAAREKWDDFLFFIHCSKAPISQQSITKAIFAQIVKNTNSSAGNGADQDSIKVQREGRVITVPLPDFDNKSMASKRKFENTTTKDFVWPVGDMSDFELTPANACNGHNMPQKKAKLPQPVAAAAGYEKIRDDFLHHLRHGDDVPPRLKEMAVFFETFSNPPLDKTIFGTGEITKDALKVMAKANPEIPFNKSLGFNVSLWANLFHSTPLQPPKPPKPDGADLDNLF